MKTIFVVGLIISAIFLVFKFIEAKFILKEQPVVKILFRDSLMVYFSVLLGNFLMDQFNLLNQGKKAGATQVFTDNPNF